MQQQGEINSCVKEFNNFLFSQEAAVSELSGCAKWREGMGNVKLFVIWQLIWNTQLKQLIGLETI